MMTIFTQHYDLAGKRKQDLIIYTGDLFYTIVYNFYIND